MNRRIHVFLVVIASFVGPSTFAQVEPTKFAVTPLQLDAIPLNTGVYGRAYYITPDASLIVGVGRVGLAMHAASWAGGAGTDLGVIGGVFSEARAANAAGRVVGHAFSWDIDNSNLIGFRTAANAPLAGADDQLSVLEGDCRSYALGINTAGVTVGYSVGDDGNRAVRWDTAGIITQIGPMGSEAYAINATGVAVGRAGNAAVRWNAGSVTPVDLGQGGGSYATAINTSGNRIVGSKVVSGARQGFGTGITDPLIGAELVNTIAYAVNAGGMVVGTGETDEGVKHAWFYDPNPQLAAEDRFVDINDQLETGQGTWVIHEARGIADSGEIVGWGTITVEGANLTVAVLLTPVAPG